MILSTFILRFVWCAIISKVVNCSQASSIDLSAIYPSDWCDKQYGTPTRTTGECICKATCEGNGCILQQGLSFYSYSKCPECKCLPPVEKQRNDYSFQSKKVNNPTITKQQNVNDNKEDDEDSDFRFSEWLEDNGRLIFAICASIFGLFITCLLFFFKV
jgi:hypothetical protein